MKNATRTAYTSKFSSLSEAIEFENAALSCGVMPPAARVVASGGEETAAYWRWLCAQADEAVRS